MPPFLETVGFYALTAKEWTNLVSWVRMQTLYVFIFAMDA
jgi:hypothetical protein